MNAVGAVFLDRDGVINENRPDHVKCWDEFRFLPGAVRAIVRMSSAGTKVFIISNQAVVNRGIVLKETVDEINSRMVQVIEQQGGRVADLAYCPHRPDEQCACRKPRPGLLLELAQAHGVDLRQSVVVGDAISDIKAGRAAGCRTVLVMTGRGREQYDRARSSGLNGFLVAADLEAATQLLLQARRKAA